MVAITNLRDEPCTINLSPDIGMPEWVLEVFANRRYSTRPLHVSSLELDGVPMAPARPLELTPDAAVVADIGRLPDQPPLLRRLERRRVGDLEGIRRRLEYLEWLGVDAVWLSPIYRSPMADGGNDVSDHCDVDPTFGDLDAFDRLLADSHHRSLRVLLDWVLNHTNDQHP